MTKWDLVLDATRGHDIQTVAVRLDDVLDGKAWIAITCACGESFTEQWEFTDHIRRLVFAVIAEGEPMLFR